MHRLYSLLGFAQKAGQLVSGEQGVEALLRRGSLFLVLLAEDSAPNTKTKFVRLAESCGVPVFLVGDKISLGMALGKSRRAIVGVRERKFALSIAQSIRQHGVSAPEQ